VTTEVVFFYTSLVLTLEKKIMKRYIYRFMYCILPNQLYTETPETKTATQFSVILDRRILSGSFFFTEIAYNFEM